MSLRLCAITSFVLAEQSGELILTLAEAPPRELIECVGFGGAQLQPGERILWERVEQFALPADRIDEERQHVPRHTRARGSRNAYNDQR